jgi:hypothetical protein
MRKVSLIYEKRRVIQKKMTATSYHKDDIAFCSYVHFSSVLLPEEYQYHKEKKRGGQNNLCAEIE